MTFTKLTKERLEQYASDPRMCNINDEIRTMAREILESRADAEPVARDAIRYRFLRDKDAFGEDNAPGLAGWDDLAELDAGDFDSAVDARIKASDIPLYTRPQPAPVVPEEIYKIPEGRGFKYVKDGIHYSSNYANGWNACRAAMLQGKSEPVSQPYTLPEWIPCSEQLPPEGYESDGAAVFCLVWHKNEVDCGPQYGISNVFFLRKHWEKNYSHWMPLPEPPQQED